METIAIVVITGNKTWWDRDRDMKNKGKWDKDRDIRINGNDWDHCHHWKHALDEIEIETWETKGNETNIETYELTGTIAFVVITRNTPLMR